MFVNRRVVVDGPRRESLKCKCSDPSRSYQYRFGSGPENKTKQEADDDGQQYHPECGGFGRF